MIRFTLLFVALLSTAAAAVDAPASDQPATISGMQVVCTGESLDAREDPRWQSFPLKVELAGDGGHYLGGAEFSVSQGDNQLGSVACAGPWLLLRLPAGHYRIAARIADQTVKSTVLVPATGQSRVILRFQGQ